MNMPDSNLHIALISLAWFFYYAALTLFLGIAAMPSRFILKEESYWNFLAAWTVGFNLLASSMVMIGLFLKIDLPHVAAANLLFLLVILLKKKKILLFLNQGFLNYTSLGIWKQKYYFVLPLSIIAILMFLSCLVPHTKVDELSIYMYFTKWAVIEQAIAPLISPYQIFLFQFVPTYNIWSFFSGGEYTASLNSFLSYIFLLLFLYQWVKHEFNVGAALWVVVLAGCSFVKIVTSIAGGDMAANTLYLLTFMLISYDLHQTIQLRRDRQLASMDPGKFLILHLLFFTGILTKVSAAFIMIPLMGYFYLMLIFRKIRVKDLFAILGFTFSISCLPFFIKQFVLYGNPIMPAGLSVFGAKGIDAAALSGILDSMLEKSLPQVSRDLWGLFTSIFYYIPAALKFQQQNPFYWICIVLGFIYLIKQKNYLFPISFALCYIASFFVIERDFFRYNSGAFDFFLIFGVIQVLSIAKATAWIKIRNTAAGGALGFTYIIAVAAGIYMSQFVAYLGSNGDRAAFVTPRIGNYETAEWVNEHLPKNAKLLVEGRERYYYDVRTVSVHPTALGEKLKVIQDHDEFYKLLRSKSVTHLMAINQKRKTHYHRFLSQSPKLKKIYSLQDTIIRGGRYIQPRHGNVEIFELL